MGNVAEFAARLKKRRSARLPPRRTWRTVPSMLLRCRDRIVHFPRRPLVMGIINLNDDSFSGDGTLQVEEALERARCMTAAGADVIDVGGESARTNRVAVPPEEEVRRVLPFIERFLTERETWSRRDEEQLMPPLLSVNTWRPAVVAPLLAAGAELLNDMGALPDNANARLAARHGTGLLIMHSVGQPKEAHTEVRWRDVVAEQLQFFTRKMAQAEEAGVSREALILDPGLDFAKQSGDSLRLLRGADKIVALGRPVLMPVSRKTVIGDVLGLPDPRERDPGTWASLVAGVRRGVAIFRVHAVHEAASCVRVAWEIERQRR
jgi:dihydropteroate synthase